ncbi:DNA polymerase III subunit delta' [Williamsia phyllosphaerae]|uniref:DNA polymerase III subunit delta n=1 Tax=Williamsia phyllosphaerae TaxID=885042 RepID=A0ABQ1U4X3_9NOCA|nr:DNA polymerase III subunit delta' [Williamsia phyllosphaerae]GGF10415.1 DNA polymerase III subunit delta' [Williamsia phyllosphaerae]
MTSVFDRLVGQQAVVDELVGAARSATAAATRLHEAATGAMSLLGEDDVVAPRNSMTHAWLFTGPPGSGRSVAAQCFAAALQCETPGEIGCGHCHACTTVMAGTHGDVRRIVPEGLSIGVKLIRDTVQIASRRPSTGRWQIVVIEDADRLSEGAANALLKVVEEPPPRTVILLCAPSIDPEDISVTLKSRCRHVPLTMPSVASIAEVLIADGIEPDMARWAASVCGGHVGRARRLATDADARDQRTRALGLARAATREATAYASAEDLVRSAETVAKAIATPLDEAETEEMRTALGAGGTGKGSGGAMRGSAGVLKALEQQQKSRTTRLKRDVLDRALVDLAALFRDALVASYASPVASMHPDMADQTVKMAGYARPEELLQCVEAVLECREVLDYNVKPRFAVDAMVAKVSTALRH